MALHPVILAGGSGSRLWPLSRRNYPKQFLDLLDQGQSLLQQTADRAGLCSDEPILVVGSEQHRFILQGQLAPKGLKLDQIILEPEARNTALSTLFACLHIRQQDPDGQILILPCDQYLADDPLLASLIKEASESLKLNDVQLVAIKPRQPSDLYGHIKLEPDGVVARFLEKPSLPLAKVMMQKGSFYWNSGIVLAHASHLLTLIAEFEPELYQYGCAAYETKADYFGFLRMGSSLPACDSISLDYTVLEKCAHLKAVIYDEQWDDLGSWSSLISRRRLLNLGDTPSMSSKPLFKWGLDDLLIIEDDDLLLAVHKDSFDQLNKLSDVLTQSNRLDLLDRLETYRPWGSFKVLAKGDNFLVKQLTIAAHGQISLQSHSHRSEHWVVVSGEGWVELNGSRTLLTVGLAITIERGAKHRLINEGLSILQVIEVQSGAILDESDIVRYDDAYERHLENK